jgi:hypothetical protein
MNPQTQTVQDIQGQLLNELRASLDREQELRRTDKIEFLKDLKRGTETDHINVSRNRE